MDGVLVATEGLKEEAHRRVLGSYGHHGEIGPPFYHSVMGLPQAEVEARYLAEAGLAGSVRPEGYHERFRATYDALLRTDLSLVPGARALVDRLSGEGWRLALVSSSLRWMVDSVLSETRLGDRFEAVITADDVALEKPAPDPYLHALESLGLRAGAAVVVEDTTAGIESARAAGLPVVALRHAWNDRLDLTGADRLLDGLEDTDSVCRALEGALEKAAASPPEGRKRRRL